jgi:hypothetical protein
VAFAPAPIGPYCTLLLTVLSNHCGEQTEYKRLIDVEIQQSANRQINLTFGGLSAVKAQNRAQIGPVPGSIGTVEPSS